jgi:hypothetical protein
MKKLFCACVLLALSGVPVCAAAATPAKSDPVLAGME